MQEKGYKKLIAWQKADELAFQIYRITKDFPREERLGITSQLRRAALSVPTNLAEAMGRQGKNESRHFINIALGSVTEVEYLLGFSKRLGFLSEDVFRTLDAERQDVSNLLFGLFRSFQRDN